MLLNVLLVGVGGALGALCRYGLSAVAIRLFNADFAWGTLKANLLGCLLIGFLFALIDQRNVFGTQEKLFFVTGFLGAMTTFSTYALESVRFAQSGNLMMAALNLSLNTLTGLCLVMVGIWLGHRV